jgi:hypothetical protein
VFGFLITPHATWADFALPTLPIYLEAGPLAWRFSLERFTGVPPTGIGGFLPAIETGQVFVRHEPNLPSGGQPADIEVGAFLVAVGNGPEKQELLRLIGTLAGVVMRSVGCV